MAALRIRRRGFVVAGIVLLAVTVVLGARIALAPKGKPIGWQLANIHSVGGPHGWDDLAAAKVATVVYLRTDWWPACHPFDEMSGNVANSSWLQPDIAYTAWSVTITMRIDDSYYQNAECGRGFYDYWGTPVAVPLSEPLGGRALFDGSTSPTAARPYP
jgi:hypothetical protein